MLSLVQRARLLAVSLIAALAMPGALADDARPAPGGRGTVPLAENPVRVHELGLTMYIPLQAIAQTTRIGGAAATRIQLPRDLGFMTVQTRRSTDTNLDAERVADGVIRQILRSAPDARPDAQPRLLSRNDDIVPRPSGSQRFYIRVPDRPGRPNTVRGVTVINTEPGVFAIIELFTGENTVNEARRMYEESVATARFADADDLAARRAAVLGAGARVLEQLTREDYQSVIKAWGERWERLYTPAASGADEDAQEHGYRRTRVWIGYRGELTPEKPRGSWTAAEQDRGYVVRIDARLLHSDSQIDSQALYFLSLDRDEEAWTVRMSIRPRGQGGGGERWTETGARLGNSLSIRTESAGSPTDTVRVGVPSDAYVSTVESYILGPLLVRAGIEADFGFYSYQTSERQVVMRRDSVSQPADRPGLWRIATRYSEDAPAQVSLFNSRGELVRTELPDGRVWQPIEANRLLEIWRRKRLPL